MSNDLCPEGRQNKFPTWTLTKKCKTINLPAILIGVKFVGRSQCLAKQCPDLVSFQPHSRHSCRLPGFPAPLRYFAQVVA